MVATLVAGTANNTNTGTQVAVTLPAAAVGDVLVVAATGAVASASLSFSTPAGWNAISPSTQPSGMVAGAGVWFWRAYQAGDPTQVTIVMSGSGRMFCFPFKILGADTANPFEAVGVTPLGVTLSNANIAAPSLDAVASRLLICFFSTRITSSGAQAALTGQSPLIDLMKGNSASGSNNTAGLVSSQVLAAAGATGVRNAKIPQQSSPVAFSALVKEAGAAPQGSVLRTQAGLVEVRRKTA